MKFLGKDVHSEAELVSVSEVAQFILNDRSDLSQCHYMFDHS